MPAEVQEKSRYRPNQGGFLLKLWREQRSMTQRDAARALNIKDEGFYSRLEHFVRTPSRQMAVLIQTMTDGMVPVGAWDRPHSAIETSPTS